MTEHYLVIKQWCPLVCSDTHDPGDCFPTWDESGTKRQMSHDLTLGRYPKPSHRYWKQNDSGQKTGVTRRQAAEERCYGSTKFWGAVGKRANEDGSQDVSKRWTALEGFYHNEVSVWGGGCFQLLLLLLLLLIIQHFSMFRNMAWYPVITDNFILLCVKIKFKNSYDIKTNFRNNMYNFFSFIKSLHFN